MNILYVSHLVVEAESGPTWSVPASIKAQAKYDNVLWVNTSKGVMPNWEKLDCFLWLVDKPLKLKNIPAPFNNPDIVVFEALYDSFQEILLSRELRMKKIPYIVIPRGSLTYMAMHNKSRWKKEIAHYFFYDTFIKGASAIQYLTKREYEDSKYRFDGTHFIIPNGINPPVNTKKSFHNDSIKGVFIGRFDRYHKGLDILVEVCERQQVKLRKNNITIDLYGTKTQDWYIMQKQIKNKGLDDIIKILGPVSGDEKEHVLLDADLFIMSSRFEGHPMGLIEALAYGLPVLISRGTNMFEEVASADAGWVFETDVPNMEKAILLMINEKRLIMRKSENAKELSLNYSWDYIASLFHNELLKLFNKK